MLNETRYAAARLAAELRQKAQNLPIGAAKDHLLREARVFDAMRDAEGWVNSAELRAPTDENSSYER